MLTAIGDVASLVPKKRVTLMMKHCFFCLLFFASLVNVRPVLLLKA